MTRAAPTPDRLDTDVLVVGGGAAGLSAAALIACAGLRCVCVDRETPRLDADDPAADLRTTAFLTPSVETLERAGVWDRLAPHAAPLWVMRLIDAGGPENEIREVADFVSTEVQERPFGYNLPNTVIRRALLERLEELPDAALRAPAALRRLVARERTLKLPERPPAASRSPPTAAIPKPATCSA